MAVPQPPSPRLPVAPPVEAPETLEDLATTLVRVEKAVERINRRLSRSVLSVREREALADMVVKRGTAAAEEQIFRRWRIKVLIIWSAFSSLLVATASVAAIYHYLRF